jgi:tetratricopeptide (TPR) repeat protein
MGPGRSRSGQTRLRPRRLCGRRAIVRTGRQISPSCDILFFLGLTQYRLKQPDAALISFESAAQCDPKLLAAHLALGEAYTEKGNHSRALAAYSRVLKLEPRNTAALRAAAAIHLRTKAHAQAIELLESLVGVEPKDAEAHADLAAAYIVSGDRERAAKHYQSALAIEPDNASALMGYGNLLLKNGQEEHSVEMLQKAAKFAPNAFEPRYLLGTAYNRLGRFDKALAALQSALKLGGGDQSEVFYHLARAYGGLGRREERAQSLARFAELTRKAKEDTAAQRRARTDRGCQSASREGQLAPGRGAA